MLAFDDIVSGALASYVKFSKTIGGDVAKHSDMVVEGFKYGIVHLTGNIFNNGAAVGRHLYFDRNNERPKMRKTTWRVNCFLCLQGSASVLVGGVALQAAVGCRCHEAAHPNFPVHPVGSVFPGEEPDIDAVQSPERHQREHLRPWMGHCGTQFPLFFFVIKPLNGISFSFLDPCTRAIHQRDE